MIRRAIGRVLLWFIEPVLDDRAALAARIRPYVDRHLIIPLRPDPLDSLRRIERIKAWLRDNPGRDAPR